MCFLFYWRSVDSCFISLIRDGALVVAAAGIYRRIFVARTLFALHFVMT